MIETKLQNPMTILVVEDEPITCNIIASILSKAGYIIKTASNGLECLDSLEEGHPDVILMDVKMPVMDGIETCRRINADPDLSGIPVVFVTSSTDDQTLEAAFDAGGRDYLRKPINPIEMLARLRLMRDLQQTHRKRLEAEKLKGVLETAGGVCHTLNQPLQYIMGAIQILIMDLPPESKMYTQLEAIREKVEQMGKITRKLSEITRYRAKAHAGGQYILDIDDSSGYNPDPEP